MKAKTLLALCVILSALSVSVEAQQRGKTPRIAYLNGGSRSAQSATNNEALRQGLRELGYVEGQNIIVEDRYAEGDRDRQRAFARDLVRLKVDVIVASSGGDTRAAKEATTTIPIVMAQSDDPVASGFVASLARPGGNITGLSSLAPELSGKRLKLLKEIVLRLSRLAVFGTSTLSGNTEIKEMERTAGAFKVQLQYLDVRDPKGLETAFRAASKESPDAVLVLQSAVFNSQRKQFAGLAVKSRLPVIYEAATFVEDGGLMSYGVSGTDLFRRAAVYVDRF